MTTQDQPHTRQPTEASEDSRPLLKLIKGNATEEELAALITVLAAMRAGDGQQSGAKPAPEWSAHRRKTRETHRHGPTGWRSSGLPR